MMNIIDYIEKKASSYQEDMDQRERRRHEVKGRIIGGALGIGAGALAKKKILGDFKFKPGNLNILGLAKINIGNKRDVNAINTGLNLGSSAIFGLTGAEIGRRAGSTIGRINATNKQIDRYEDANGGKKVSTGRRMQSYFAPDVYDARDAYIGQQKSASEIIDGIYKGQYYD